MRIIIIGRRKKEAARAQPRWSAIGSLYQERHVGIYSRLRQHEVDYSDRAEDDDKCSDHKNYDDSKLAERARKSAHVWFGARLKMTGCADTENLPATGIGSIKFA
jgi:hypothetical protein